MKQPRLIDARKPAVTVAGEWTDNAACRDSDPDIFFPEELPSRNRADALHQQAVTMTALSICGRCTVREQCLAYGLNEDWGIWGGTLPSQRLKIRNYNPRKALF